MNRTLHFAFGVNDGYFPYVIVTIKSILENNKDAQCHFHILTDGISVKNKNRLAKETHQYSNSKVEYHIVNTILLNGIKSTWSVFAWLRIFLPEILSNIDKVLYLDADIIVNDNLSDLFDMDMTGKSIAAVLDIQNYDINTFIRCGYPKEKEYICSGVLLMNLDYWRKYNITEKIIDWSRENNERIKFPDQDAINYICRDTKVLLPLKYGIIDAFFTSDSFVDFGLSSQIKESFHNPAIIHYAGQSPWIIERAKHTLQTYWNNYNHQLIKPIQRKYESKGVILLKVILWRLLNSGTAQTKYATIRNKINSL